MNKQSGRWRGIQFNLKSYQFFFLQIPSCKFERTQLFQWCAESVLLFFSENTPPDASFTGSMQLLAGVKLCTDRHITNHPHYENKFLRERTKQVTRGVRNGARGPSVGWWPSRRLSVIKNLSTNWVRLYFKGRSQLMNKKHFIDEAVKFVRALLQNTNLISLKDRLEPKNVCCENACQLTKTSFYVLMSTRWCRWRRVKPT